MAFTVVLEGGAPWGLRLQGGREFNEPLRVAKINPNSKAHTSGIQIGDYVESINQDKTQGLNHTEALELIRNAKDTLSLQLKRQNYKPGAKTNQAVNGDINHNTKFNGLNTSGEYRSPQRPVISPYGGHTPRGVISPTPATSGNRHAMTSPFTDTEMDYGSPSRISARKFNISNASPGPSGPSSPATSQKSQALFAIKSPPLQRKQQQQRPGTPGGSHRHPGLKAFFRPPVVHEGLQTTTLPPNDAPAPSPLSHQRPMSAQSYNLPQARVGPTYIGGSAAAWNTGRSATPNSYYSPQLPRAGQASGRITPGFVNAPGYYSSPQLPRAFTYTPGPELSRSMTGTPIPGGQQGRETPLSPPPMGRVTPMGLGSGRVSPTSGRDTPTYVVSPFNRAIPSGRNTPSSSGHPMSPPSRSKGLAIFEKQRMKHNIEMNEQNEIFYGDRMIKTESIKSPEPVRRAGSSQGVWSPGKKLSVDIPDRDNNDHQADVFRDVPQVWSPQGNNNGGLSPKKEFRPVKLDISSVSTRSKTPVTSNNSQVSEIPIRQQPGHTTASTTVTTTTSTTSMPSSSSTSSYNSWNGSISHFSETKSGLPTSQSPMITLLQKNREGHLPKGATYIEETKTSEPPKTRETAYVMPTNQVTITSKKKEEPSPPKVKGVGPTTDAGLPTSLRTSVDDQKDWYKKMFKNLNADDKPKDINTYSPTYVFPEEEIVPEKAERNPYKPSYEFPSSPSDKSNLTNGTDKKISESRSITSPGRDRASWSPPHARYRNEVYRNQPRSITDYEPGFSSIALKESKINQQLFNPPIDKPGQFSKYTYNNQDVRLKKEERPFSPDVNTRAAYKQIQQGGEIPVSGLRQPYPERRACLLGVYDTEELLHCVLRDASDSPHAYDLTDVYINSWFSPWDGNHVQGVNGNRLPLTWSVYNAHFNDIAVRRRKHSAQDSDTDDSDANHLDAEYYRSALELQEARLRGFRMPGPYLDGICDQNSTGVPLPQRKSSANRFSFTRAEIGSDSVAYPDGFTFPHGDNDRLNDRQNDQHNNRINGQSDRQVIGRSLEDLPNDSLDHDLRHNVLLAQHRPKFSSTPVLNNNKHGNGSTDPWDYPDLHSRVRENVGRHAIKSNLDSHEVLDALDRQEASKYMQSHDSPVRLDREKLIRNGQGRNIERSPDSTNSSNGVSPRQGVLRGSLSPAERVEKKKKKVRVRRHDSLITNNNEFSVTKDDTARALKALEDEDFSFMSNDNQSIISENSYAADVESVNLSMDRRHQESLENSGLDNSGSSRGRPPLPKGIKAVPRPRSAPTIETVLRPRSMSPDSFSHLMRQKNATDFFIDLKDLRNSFGSEGSDRSSRIDPQTYQSYTAGILNSSHPSEKFLHLQKHYATLERISELEKDSIRRDEQLDALPTSLAYTNMSERRKLIMSRYKLENLEELRELYAGLTDAQMADEFYFDPNLFEDYQWSAFKDVGLRCRSNSLEDIREVYEANKTPKNTEIKRKKRLDEFRRELSFKKLTEKYKYLDDESRKKKIMNEMWFEGRRSRRGSDASSVISTASTLPGSYLAMMETAAERAKQRPMYGYNIKDNNNRYEMYVDKVKKMSKSMPDVSKTLHVRSESEPKIKARRKMDLPDRSNSFKHTNFGVNTSPQPGSTDDSFGSSGKAEDDQSYVVMPVYGFTRNSSNDKVRSPLNVDTSLSHRRSKDNESPGSKESSSGFSSMSQGTLLDEVDGNSLGRKKREFDRTSARRASGRERNPPPWRSEIRGVVGSESPARSPLRSPVRSASEQDLLSPVDKSRKMLSKSQDNLDYIDGLMDKPDRKELRFRHDDVVYSERKQKTDEAWAKVEREKWRRKDSKPNPGAVLAALQMYESAVRQHNDELEKDVWYPERRSQARASMRVRSSRSHDDLDARPRPSSALGEILTENISVAKSKFDSLGRDSKNVPRTALSSASRNTALGRYEARIRGSSEEPTLKSAKSMPKDLDNSPESATNLKHYKSVPDLDQNARNSSERKSFRSMDHSSRGQTKPRSMSPDKGAGYTLKYDPNTGDISPVRGNNLSRQSNEPVGKSNEVKVRHVSPRPRSPRSPKRDSDKSADLKREKTSIPKGPSYEMDKYPLLNQIAAEMDSEKSKLNRRSVGKSNDNSRAPSVDNSLGRGSSTDTLIIRSDSEHSPVHSLPVRQIASEFEKRTESDRTSLAKSKSEPNLADSVSKTEPPKPAQFYELKSRYESAPNLDQNDGPYGQDSEDTGYRMRRTVSGDLLDISDRFSDMVADNKMPPPSTGTGAVPKKLTKAALRSQENLDSIILPEIPRLTRRDSGNSLTSSVRDEYLRKFQRHYDVVRPATPPSADAASRMFAMNIDTIDREWQQEKRKRSYLKERVIKPDEAIKDSYRQDGAVSSEKPNNNAFPGSQNNVYGSIRRKSDRQPTGQSVGKDASQISGRDQRSRMQDLYPSLPRAKSDHVNVRQQRGPQSQQYPSLQELGAADAKHHEAYYGTGTRSSSNPQVHGPPYQSSQPERKVEQRPVDQQRPVDGPDHFPQPSYPAPQLSKHQQPRLQPPQPHYQPEQYHPGYQEAWHDNRIPSHHRGYPQAAEELGDVPSTPRHVSAAELHSPSSETMDRKKRDEEAARRREQMEKIYAEERRRKMEQEKIANEARRHHDIYSPMQKSPIPAASERFEDALTEHENATNLKRPNSAKPTHHMRGKAKALYSFTAQNPKELSFKKGSIIYLLREIDNNWYEGEFRGQVGIFPKNYVEVTTSIETARQSAMTREGHAKARYNFTAATSVELPLKKGEIVQLVRRVDENWYEGRVGHRQGIVPVSYVDVIQEPDTPLMTPMSSIPNTPRIGSPSQLSPGSSIGHAPTIPEAPLSPWGVDDLDLMASYDQFFRPPSQLQQQPSQQHLHPQQHQQQASHRSPSAAANYAHHVADTSSSPAASRHIYNQAYEIAQQQSGGRGDPYAHRHNSSNPNSLLNGGLLMPGMAPLNRHSTYENFDRGQRQHAEPPRQPSEHNYPRFRARFRYNPQNDDELELQENDVVQVMEKCDDGWFVGTSLRTNEFGTFPGNYVEPV